MEPLFSLYSRFTVGTFLNLSPRPLISLACVSSETHNLQRVFATGGGGGCSPLYRLYQEPITGYIGMCRLKRYVCFSRFGLKWGMVCAL